MTFINAQRSFSSLSQSYYYNLKTRETTWTKPEDVKIITQQEVDTLSNTPSASDDEKNGETERSSYVIGGKYRLKFLNEI